MSKLPRRSAFSPDAISELGEILPTIPLPTPAAEAAPHREPSPLTLAPPAPAEDVEAESAPAPQAARGRAPEIAIAPEVYKALRALTLREREVSPSHARTYGQVVLDAVEDNATTLARHWRNGRQRPKSSLFQRVNPEAPRRRRHSQAPARVPLAGILASDAAQLDRLAVEWGAGSRSALAEQALRLYLEVAPVPTDG
jgi:hypothetical protein